jgi:hypothetical protein
MTYSCIIEKNPPVRLGSARTIISPISIIAAEFRKYLWHTRLQRSASARLSKISKSAITGPQTRLGRHNAWFHPFEERNKIESVPPTLNNPHIVPSTSPRWATLSTGSLYAVTHLLAAGIGTVTCAQRRTSRLPRSEVVNHGVVTSSSVYASIGSKQAVGRPRLLRIQRKFRKSHLDFMQRTAAIFICMGVGRD